MRYRGLSVFLTLLLFGVALVSAPAWAQQTGDIDGTVVDSNSAPLPGVSVEVRSTALLGTRTTVTDGAGRYRFPALPPGAYTVSASLSGFTKAEKAARVDLSATATIPIMLSVSVKEEVVVTGEAPVVDTTKNIVGTSTSIDTIQKLPLARNYTSIATTVAGTGNDVSGITVYGATGLENQYIIDGVNTTGVKLGDQGKTLNQEFVQEVEVKTGGYEAEYSHALGGIINVVTKSGGNEFHGDAFGYYDSESLAANDKRSGDREAIGAGTLYLPKRLDAGADLGGYFVRDRLWFFGAFDRVNRDQKDDITLSQSYADKSLNILQQTDTTRTSLFSGKLTFRLGESNTVAVSAFGDPGTFNGNITGPVVGPQSALNGEQKNGGTDFSAKWDGIFGTMFLAQAQYGYHEDKNEQTPLNSGLAVRDRRTGYLTQFEAGSGNPLWFKEKYRRNDYHVSGSLFLGANEVKAGIDYEGINSSFDEQYGGGTFVTNFLSRGSGAYSFSSDRYFASVPLNCIGTMDANGNVVTGNFGTPGSGNANVPNRQSCFGYSAAATVQNPPSTKNTGIFAQDSFKVLKNLTINAGIRYDQQKLNNAGGQTVIDLKNEWSPRLGVVWDFMNNGKSKLSASYGRYYEIIPQDIQTRALGNEYTVFAYNYTQSAKDPLTNPNVAPYAYIQGGEIVGSGIKGMYQDEVIVGLEYEVFRNWSLGVKGIYKALGRAVEDRCDLADPRVNLSGYIPADALTTCALINPGDGGNALDTIRDPSNPACIAADGSISGNCDSTHARRYYRALELDATHRFSSNFYVLASYIYSKLEGSYDGNLKQSTGQADPNINADFDYVDMLPNSFGRLALDRKNQFKVTGTYSFPFGLSAGGTLRYSSGAPTSVVGYARPGYLDEAFLTSRGSFGDLPSTNEMDLHLEYNARFGAVTVTPIVDIFNLFDHQTVTARNMSFNRIASGVSNGANPQNQYNDPAWVPSGPSQRIDQAACTANPGYANKACSTNSLYMLDTAWQNPRLIRIGARVSF